MRLLVPAILLFGLAPHVDAKPALRIGEVAGTAFLLGPFPETGTSLPLHTSGDPHPRDWTGAKDADYVGLWDVVVSAFPLDTPSAARPSDPSGFPETGALILDGMDFDHVVVATSDNLELWNFEDEPVTLNAVKDGRTQLTISIKAKQVEPPASLDISSLKAGVYELIDASAKKRHGWLYRAASEEFVVGPTSGNCRYALELAPGRYKIRAWHPYLTPIERIVTVRARIATRMNPVFKMPKEEGQ